MLQTAKHVAKFGFTLVEMVLVLLVVVVLGGLFFPARSATKRWQKKESEALTHTQLEAMAGMKQKNVSVSFWFNKNGNINRSGRFKYREKTCLIYLGVGRWYCE